MEADFKAHYDAEEQRLRVGYEERYGTSCSDRHVLLAD